MQMKRHVSAVSLSHVSMPYAVSTKAVLWSHVSWMAFTGLFFPLLIYLFKTNDFPYHISELAEGMHPVFLCFPSSLDSVRWPPWNLPPSSVAPLWAWWGPWPKDPPPSASVAWGAHARALWSWGSACGSCPGHGRHVAAKKDGLDVDFYNWNQSITVLSLCCQLELTWIN